MTKYILQQTNSIIYAKYTISRNKRQLRDTKNKSKYTIQEHILF